MKRLNITSDNFDEPIPSDIEEILFLNMAKPFNKKLPLSLRNLSMSVKILTSFNMKLPSNLEELRLSYTKIISFKTFIPKSLRVFYIYGDHLKKLKLNRRPYNMDYNSKIKNKKTFQKRWFYHIN